MRCHFNQALVENPAALPALYPIGEFRSRSRSTVPLLSLVMHHQAVLRGILGACGLEGDIDLAFEFQVRSPRGDGNPSHTDLMVRTATACMAVEAKWTEPPYPTVGRWLGKAPTSNRLNVLGGWLDLIGRRTGSVPSIDAVEAITYQTIHRAASVCHVDGMPRLAYLQFLSADQRGAAILEHRRADLSALCEALGHPPGFPVFVIELAIEPTPAFAALAILKHDSTEMEDAVKQALPATPLFTFGTWRLHQLTK
jgi:hypothetical protein